MRITLLMAALLLGGCVSISGPTTHVVEHCEHRTGWVRDYEHGYIAMDHKVCYLHEVEQ